MNHSSLGDSMPEENSISLLNREVEGSPPEHESLRWRKFITSIQTGAAPVTPLTFHIGSPEKFPTHTPTVYFFEYPMHQLSLMSLLVPVLTAVQKRVANGFSNPKVRLRASLSA